MHSVVFCIATSVSYSGTLESSLILGHRRGVTSDRAIVSFLTVGDLKNVIGYMLELQIRCLGMPLLVEAVNFLSGIFYLSQANIGQCFPQVSDSTLGAVVFQLRQHENL